MLEADDDIIGIAQDDHVALGLALSPALGPEIEGVVQVDVGQERGADRTLRRPPRLATTCPSSITPAFSHLRIRPMTRRSPIRCSTKRTIQSWLIRLRMHRRRDGSAR